MKREKKKKRKNIGKSTNIGKQNNSTKGAIELIFKLNDDLKRAARLMSHAEARYLVDLYYQVQHFRIVSESQIRSMETEPHQLLNWVFDSMGKVESHIKKALDIWSDQHAMGLWAKAIRGIGPVLSSGLLAHIDITKTKTAGGLWRFAGLDPTSHWKKKTKRPWNAALKVVCWKIGESFVMQSGKEDSLYAELWKKRKIVENEGNDRGDFAEQAKAALEAKNYNKKTDAFNWYNQGKLPPAHIHARAKRWAVKIFLCHWWEEAYRQKYKKEPPEIYSIVMLGHAHKIQPEKRIDQNKLASHG